MRLKEEPRSFIILGLVSFAPSDRHWTATQVKMPLRVAKRSSRTIQTVNRLTPSSTTSSVVPHSPLQLQAPASHGFRKKRQAAELIQTVRILLERRAEWDLPVAVCKLDVNKTYDSVLREAVQWLSGSLSAGTSLGGYRVLSGSSTLLES